MGTKKAATQSVNDVNLLTIRRSKSFYHPPRTMFACDFFPFGNLLQAQWPGGFCWPRTRTDRAFTGLAAVQSFSRDHFRGRPKPHPIQSESCHCSNVVPKALCRQSRRFFWPLPHGLLQKEYPSGSYGLTITLIILARQVICDGALLL